MSETTSPMDTAPDHGNRIQMLTWASRCFAAIQFLLGVVASIGLAAFAGGTDANSSRYQYLIAPAIIWILSVPFLLASILLYRQFRPVLGAIDRIWFNVGVSLPWFGLAGVFLLPFLLQ